MSSGPKWFREFFEETGDAHIVKCKVCQKELSVPSKMRGNLLRHLRPKKPTDCSRADVEFTAKALLNQPTVKQVIKAQRESKAPLPLPTVAAIDERLVDWVVDGEIGLCVVERSSFLLLVHSLNDRYTVPSSYKLRKSIFGRVNESTQALEKLISSSRFVTLTIDGWSSQRRLSFIGIICHMMLEGGGMTEAALHCHYFRGSHNAKKYAQVLLSTIMKWKLGSKLVCIETDNDSSILKACRDEMELNCVEDEDEECGEHTELDNKEDVAEVELITDGNDENSVALLPIKCDFAEVSKKLLEAGDGALPAALRQKGLLLFHYRCANHLMNLAVGDFLNFATSRKKWLSNIVIDWQGKEVVYLCEKLLPVRRSVPHAPLQHRGDERDAVEFDVFDNLIHC